MHVLIIAFFLLISALPAAAGVVLSLEDAERLFLENNLEIQSRKMDLRKGDASILDAKTLQNPSLQYSIESLKNGSRETEETYAISQSLDISGKRGRRIDAARKSREAQGLLLAHEISGLIVQMKLSFYKVLLLRENEKAMSEIAGIISEAERKTWLRVQAGDASEADLMKLQGERARIIRVHEALRSDLRSEKNRLALLLNVGSADFDISGEFVYKEINTGGGGPEESGLLNRPDLQGQLRNIEAAELAVSASHKEAFPILDLEAGYKKRTGGFDGLVFGVSIPLPLFDRNQAGIARAEAGLAQERTAYEAMKKAAAAEVDLLSERISSLRTRIADFMQETGRAKELTRIAGISYEEGEAGLLELLDAARSEKDLVIEKNTAVYDYWSAHFEFERALGMHSPLAGGMK